MKHDPLSHFIAIMEEEQERLANMVMTGQCIDFVSYREMVAQFKSVSFSIDAAKKAFSGDEEGD